MCGIVGYIGKKEKKEIILNGLKELEYRGYDSSGMAVMEKENDNIEYFKAVGKIKNLKEKTKDFTSNGQGIAIGHTRWATHGKPTEINAHPHYGEYSFVIHNGIIENYKEIKEDLEKKGVKFLSQTDTEVIVYLFENILKTETNPFKAFEKTVEKLIGSFAILLITKANEDKIFFAKNAVPLIVATNENNEILFSSSDAPIIGMANDAMYLDDGTYGEAEFGKVRFFKNGKEIHPPRKALPKDRNFAQKEGFRFFMEKEIYEQSDVATETLMGRIKNDQIHLDEIDLNMFDGINNIILCACGTSYHAALTASYLFERVAKTRTKVEIASEFRYKDPVLDKDSLFIAISQSGETADTLEALKIAKNNGLKTLAICNVDNSSIVRLANNVLLTRAGIEKGVASTKAFTTQVLTLWMVVLYLAHIKKTLSENELKNEVKSILKVPKILKVPDGLQDKIHRLSKHYLHGHGFFFIGRDVFFPLALEGALKLKEISYLHAEGYASGEMKHGPIALVDERLFTIALLPQNILYDKTRSNVEEIVARDGFVFAISPKEFDLSDDFIKTSDQKHYMCEFFEMLVILQLFALEISIRLGNDVDMPRNLAKSVTVE
ncbi:L-glutamine:D-fructose-6-phosphate aminotransferase [Campylobacter blaseri]|uniref:Glutamine--fructose-6-phosphate aminotransferase [isomerizing] n=1 Tax=Campylobacter blaseri TaxID=2042961 RepID=A0A2P8QYL7_9BACT|nr:glutamine--fructose-6-phosphate transaminase (isomerizing) [Campylobacter blaseri]PSM51337.1 glutamine--fructose-6-phosphate transaminase (isomerizing) [Campylobacter blaseri]PSM52481.1 glutamine--fructose-6-phosphate transaminase (isomerizing) [Campylobacter blaseri]QKF86188.1 L-glutamine:D-fructose-6-phosphate aminotransferase [Campylobacter blaseri]